jgi:hypothetical protein
MPDREAVLVHDGHAPFAAKAVRGGGGKIAAQGGVDGAEAVGLTGQAGKAEKRRQRDYQFREAGRLGLPAGAVVVRIAVGAAIVWTAIIRTAIIRAAMIGTCIA